MSGGLRQRLGAEGEQLAHDFLTKKGYRCRERNFRLRGGEVDLIMEDGATLVFVEVKLRRSLDYGTASEAVTPNKMRRMTKTALTYVAQHRIVERMIRFDVIAIDSDGIQHVPNAFEVAGHYYF